MLVPPATLAFVEDTITIRSLEPSEWQVLRALRLEALADAPEAFTSSIERERAFAEADWRQRLENLLVAFAGERPVGLVAWWHRDDQPLVAMLGYLWVHPDHRGTNAAEQLVAKVRDAVLTTPEARLELDVFASNDRAVRFYERVGFVAVPAVRTTRPAGAVEQRLLRMQLPVNADAADRDTMR